MTDDPRPSNYPARMSDVARLADVAVSTVSRALTDPGRVNQKTRQRIVAAAETLGYSVNLAASNFRKKTSKLILLVLPPSHPVNPLVLDVLHGIDSVLARHQYRLLISNFGQVDDLEKHTLDLAYGRVPDGALIISGRIARDRGRSMTTTGLPTVSILYDLTDQGISSVVTNDRAAMKEATRHLLDLGHRHIAYVSGPAGNYHEQERYQGVLDALAEAGADSDSIQRIDGDFSPASGDRAAAAILEIAKRPTAVLCCSDMMAVPLLSRLKTAGLSIPRDMAVCGFDGIVWGRYMTPTLTTVEQPSFGMGKAGAELLVSMMMSRDQKDDEAKLVRLDSELSIRGSTLPMESMPDDTGSVGNRKVG